MHRHVGHAMTQHLIGGQRLAELDPDFGIVDGCCGRRLHQAKQFGAPGGDGGINRVLQCGEGALICHITCHIICNLSG